MAFKNLSLWAAMACTVMLVNTQSTQHNVQKRGGIRLCGRLLTETLAMVCDTDYVLHVDTAKRNYAYSGDTIPNWENSFSGSDGFVRPQTALDIFSVSNVPRNARGIVDECCRKKCT
ncbi:hypothetical protein X975_16491, partial [Stegodyphus mimosarum]